MSEIIVLFIDKRFKPTPQPMHPLGLRPFLARPGQKDVLCDRQGLNACGRALARAADAADSQHGLLVLAYNANQVR